MSALLQKCTDALTRYGPMSMTGIAEKTGLSRVQISKAISASRRSHGTLHFVVVGFEEKSLSGQHDKPKIYALGPGIDSANSASIAMRDENLSPFERIFGKR